MSHNINRRAVLAGSAAVAVATVVPGASAVASAAPQAATGWALFNSSECTAAQYAMRLLLQEKEVWGKDLYAGRCILTTTRFDVTRHVWANIAEGWISEAIHSQPNRLGDTRRTDGSDHHVDGRQPLLEFQAVAAGVIVIDRELTADEHERFKFVRYGRIGRAVWPDFWPTPRPSPAEKLILRANHDHTTAPDGLTADGRVIGGRASAIAVPCTRLRSTI
jgi:hypothetical protein